MTTIVAVHHFIQMTDDSPLDLSEYILVFTTHSDDSGDAQVRRLVAETIIDVADSFETMDMTTIDGASFVGQLIARAVDDDLIVMPIPIAMEGGEETLTLILYASGGVGISLGVEDDIWDPTMFVLRFATDSSSWN